MDKPKCPVCKGKHYSNEPHIWDDLPEKSKKPAPTKKRKTVVSEPEMFDAYQKILARREYMKTYMRDYRKRKEFGE